MRRREDRVLVLLAKDSDSLEGRKGVLELVSCRRGKHCEIHGQKRLQKSYKKFRKCAAK